MLIVMALSFSVMRALLPHATGYLEDIQKELTSQLGLPVSIKSLDADMDWLVPRLKIIDLIVYKKNGEEQLIHFTEANFSLAYIDSLLNLSPAVGAIDLVGAKIFIERHENNRWVIQGQEINGDLSEKTAEPSQLAQSLRDINYSLLDSHIHWRDFTHQTEDMEFKGVDVKIESFLGSRNFDIKVNLPEQYGDTLQVTAEVDGDVLFPDRLKGKIYINGTSLNIENCLSKFDLDSDVNISGLADVSLWIYFGENKIKKVAGEISSTDVEVSNLKHSNVIWDTQNLDFLFLYRKLSNGWRIDVDDLAVVKNDEAWPHESKLIFKQSDGIKKAFSADYLRLQDVIPLAYIFSDINDDEISKQLDLDEVTGDIYNISSRTREDKDDWYLKATAENLAFYLSEENIDVQGIDGTITVENNNIKLQLDSDQLRLDFQGTFRAPIKLDTVTGDIEISSTSNSFSIRSSNITAANADLNLTSRINMNQSDGISHLDMQVDFFDANTKSLHQYYPVNVLSARTIDWLDDAINEGWVNSGSFVFRGNPSNFPFHNSDGVMEVDFTVDDLNLHYLDGWPNIEYLDANIRFYNESMTIENGAGQTLGSSVFYITAVIPDLDNPILTVTGKAESDASNIQKYVWNSGLDDLLGNALKQFSMKGDSKLDFYLKTPLDNNDQVEVNGKLNFSGAQLKYPALNYVISEINGELSFTEENMSADNIKAKFGKSDVVINIIPDNTPENQKSVINLSGDLNADVLLNSFDWIPEAWIDGHSKWSADIHIPYTEKEHLVRIAARSQLENVAVNISDGIQKKSTSPLPFDVEIFVLDDELKVNVTSENKFDIKATLDDRNIWEIDITSDIVIGKTKFKQDVSTDSTVYLDLESITLDAFLSRKSKNALSALLPISIPSLEIKINALAWDEWKFSDVKLITGWHPQGMVIKEYRLGGPSLAIDGMGSWMYSWRHTHQSSFKINVSSSNLGSALDTAGIITGLKGSKFTSTSDWQWQGEPYAFSWDKVKGQSNVKLVDGVMSDISPGRKGRLLGLFNILELPKRVSLDFGDVYKKGFAFDKVSANFKLENGNAHTERIDVKAAAANVIMSGRIGIHQQDYDLEVLVKPRTKEASFAGGTIIGGPLLGAGIVILQNLFKIDELSYDKYTITGTWDKPITTRISKAK